MTIIAHSLVARLAQSLMNANAFLEVNAGDFAFREVEGDVRTSEEKLHLFARAKKSVDDRLMSYIYEVTSNDEKTIEEVMTRVNAYIKNYYLEVKRKRDERLQRQREIEAERAAIAELLAA